MLALSSSLPCFPFLVYFFFHTRLENGTGSVVFGVGIGEVTTFCVMAPLKHSAALLGPCRKPGVDLTIRNITSILSAVTIRCVTRVLPAAHKRGVDGH